MPTSVHKTESFPHTEYVVNPKQLLQHLSDSEKKGENTWTLRELLKTPAPNPTGRGEGGSSWHVSALLWNNYFRVEAKNIRQKRIITNKLLRKYFYSLANNDKEAQDNRCLFGWPSVSALGPVSPPEWPCLVCASSFTISHWAQKKIKWMLDPPSLLLWFLWGAGRRKQSVPLNVIVMRKAWGKGDFVWNKAWLAVKMCLKFSVVIWEGENKEISNQGKIV